MPKGIYKRKPNQGFQKGHEPWNMGLTKEIDERLKKAGKKISENHKGFKHPNWKGGRIVDDNGRISIYCPNHPFTRNGSYIFEHRLVMEKYLGRYLKPHPEEIVHHIDGNPSNNKIENLEVLTKSEHAREHGLGKLGRRFARGEKHYAFGKHRSEESRNKQRLTRLGKKYGSNKLKWLWRWLYEN